MSPYIRLTTIHPTAIKLEQVSSEENTRNWHKLWTCLHVTNLPKSEQLTINELFAVCTEHWNQIQYHNGQSKHMETT